MSPDLDLIAQDDDTGELVLWPEHDDLRDSCVEIQADEVNVVP